MTTHAEDPTAEVTDLLQQLIRNQCVNDGTVASGEETRSVDLLSQYLSGVGDTETFEPRPGRTSLVTRIEGSDPDVPSLLLMGHTDVVPVNLEGWSRDPFAADVVDGFVWGRGAVDMLNLTASQAVAFRRLADSGFTPRGTPDLSRGRRRGGAGRLGRALAARSRARVRVRRLRAHRIRRLPGADARRSSSARRRRREGHVLVEATVRGTPGHGSQPFRPTTRWSRPRKWCAGSPSTGRTPRSTILGGASSTACSSSPEMAGALLDSDEPSSDALSELPLGIARHWHACTHTTFAPTVMHGGTKTNVIPDRVDLEVDIRTLPGQTGDHTLEMLRDAFGDLADSVEVTSNDDPPRRSPDRHAVVGHLVAGHEPHVRGERTGAVVHGGCDRQPLLPRARPRSATASACSRSVSPTRTTPRCSTATTSASTRSRSPCRRRCGKP